MDTDVLKSCSCPLDATIAVIGGKYKLDIIYYLFDRTLRYSELARLVKATPKMLSQQLHALEDCGMINRKVIPENPPRTLYSLTVLGKSIIPVLDSMCNWGTTFLDSLDRLL